MCLRSIALLRRRSMFCAPVAVLALTFAAFSTSIASAQSPDQFASSTQSLIADNAEPAAPTPTLSPAPAGGQASGSYGYHDHSFMSHLAVEAGGGFNAPIGNDQPFITWGGNFTIGGGYKFSKRVSLLAEYQFMDDKLPGGLISDAGAQGGHAHIWSFTLDPVIDLMPNRRNSVYVTGGGGFYRKVTSFTDPEEVEECYYFCGIGYENVVVSHFSSNQGGVNFGVGVTHKLGSDSNMKAFAEVRYVWLNTPGIGTQNGLGTTELLPVTLGVRW